MSPTHKAAFDIKYLASCNIFLLGYYHKYSIREEEEYKGPLPANLLGETAAAEQAHYWSAPPPPYSINVILGQVVVE